jgi:hypothetical protein
VATISAVVAGGEPVAEPLVTESGLIAPCVKYAGGCLRAGGRVMNVGAPE